MPFALTSSARCLRSLPRLCGLHPVVRLGLLLAAAGPLLAKAPPPPNIIFILADDLGYVDTNRYAEHLTGVPAEKQYYETPNLDRLGLEGTAFSQGYACHLCAPSRAGLITGRNAAKIGFMTATAGTVRTYYNQGRTPPPGYMAADAIYWGEGEKFDRPQALLNGSTLDAVPSGQPLDQGRDEISFAEALAGYRTGIIGKWHLGNHGAKGWQPHDQGFEELAYFDEGGSPYFDWRKLWDRKKKVFATMPQAELAVGKTDPATEKAYLTEALTDTAVNFIREQAAAKDGRPFCLYFCEFAVHTPFQAKPEDIAYFEKKATKGWNGHNNATYAAMLKGLDDSVGRLLQVLKETGLDNNTVVVFMSDNGGVTYTKPAATSNAPLKGGKALMFEGGIRVPLVFRWPGHVPAGQWSDVPVTYEDMFPTLLDMAGIDPKPHYNRIDGRSLTSLFRDPTNKSHGYARDTFYWHYPLNVQVVNPEDGVPSAPHSAIREGDYKLIFDWSGHTLLYDLKSDFQEQHDLSPQMPEKTKDLFTKLNRWLDENVAVKYTPALNPNYDPQKEVRPTPFIDQRKALLGPAKAIRAPEGDPRLEELLLNQK